MDKETEQIISERFALLPRPLQVALGRLKLSEVTQDIARKNNLHIDKSGTLYTETLLILLGIEKIKDYENNLRNELEITSSQATEIVRDINERVFKVLRKNLQEGDEMLSFAQTPPAPQVKALSNPPRIEVLSEIENPAPTKPIISKEPEIVIKRGPEKPWEQLKKNIGSDFVSNKLTQTVAIPPQRNIITPNQNAQKPTGYTGDPYRESLPK